MDHVVLLRSFSAQYFVAYSQQMKVKMKEWQHLAQGPNLDANLLKFHFRGNLLHRTLVCHYHQRFSIHWMRRWSLMMLF